MARPNRRPPLRLSTLPLTAYEINIEGRCLVICCPACSSWRSVKRSMIHPHRQAEEASPWCRGSGQRLIVDLKFAVWRAERRRAIELAARRAVRLQLPHTPHRLHAPPALHICLSQSSSRPAS